MCLSKLGTETFIMSIPVHLATCVVVVSILICYLPYSVAVNVHENSLHGNCLFAYVGFRLLMSWCNLQI